VDDEQQQPTFQEGALPYLPLYVAGPVLPARSRGPGLLQKQQQPNSSSSSPSSSSHDRELVGQWPKRPVEPSDNIGGKDDDVEGLAPRHVLHSVAEPLPLDPTLEGLPRQPRTLQGNEDSEKTGGEGPQHILHDYSDEQQSHQKLSYDPIPEPSPVIRRNQKPGQFSPTQSPRIIITKTLNDSPAINYTEKDMGSPFPADDPSERFFGENEQVNLPPLAPNPRCHS
jgi:hypothetical protein